ncbi:MAG: TetR/AcrR family transcriptional regulator [Roseiflexaceae bacterium]
MTKHRINRTLVIDTAAHYVNTHGFAALTLAAVAHELGIKLPSLYNHVSGIDDLQGALAAHAAEALFVCCQDAAIGRSGDTALLAIAHAYRDFIRHNQGTYAATLHPQPRENPALVQANQALMQLFTRVLEPYALSPDDTIHVLRGLRSLVHGFCTLEATRTFAVPVDPAESFRIMLEWYIASIPHITHIQ